MPIAPAIKPDIGNHRFTQIEDTDRHGFIRVVFKSFVFIRVYVVDKSTGPEPLRGCVHL